jgi:hypothetical protein
MKGQQPEAWANLGFPHHLPLLNPQNWLTIPIGRYGMGLPLLGFLQETNAAPLIHLHPC